MQDSQESEGSVPLEQITERRRELLKTLDFADGEANTSFLRQHSNVPEGSLNYHLRKLEEWDLIEVVGRKRVGSGDPAKVWSLTESGEEMVADLETITGDLGRPPSASELADRVDELEESLRGMQDDLPKIVSELVEKELENRRE